MSSTKTNFLEIDIVDNGRGISQTHLKRIGEKGFTHGKQKGNGLGMHYAKKFAEDLGGEFLVKSKVGMGTTITLVIPVVDPPAWFTDQVSLNGSQKKIVILDDDQSTHSLWKTRFSSPPFDLTHLKAFSEEEFEKVVGEKDNFLLVDEQLSENGMRGHQIIEKYKISDRALLVTSHFFDTELQNHAMKCGYKILPKDLIKQCLINGITPIKTQNNDLDLVLIDDHYITGLVWTIKAKEKNKNFASFKSPKDFLKTDISKSTPIYVDLHFNGKMIGIDLLMELNSKGYVDLHVATSNPQGTVVPDFVKSVQGKEFPA